jgi:hypothetical protein
MPLPDDVPIDDACVAYRLIRPDWIKPDGPSSAAFQDHPGDGKMSVFLADAIEAEGRRIEELAESMPGYRICELTVGELRELGEVVTRQANDFFPGHANCKSDKGNRPGSIRKKISRKARWVD